MRARAPRQMRAHTLIPTARSGGDKDTGVITFVLIGVGAAAAVAVLIGMVAYVRRNRFRERRALHKALLREAAKAKQPKQHAKHESLMPEADVSSSAEV